MSKSPILIPDAAWVRERQRFVAQIKAETLKRAGAETRDLKKLREHYENSFKRVWKASSKAELLGEIERADIVYGGDFHALGQAQRTHLRILRELSSERQLILALECFGSDAQKWLDQYSAGKIDLEKLKQAVRWNETWGFTFDGFRALLELSKQKKFKLVALNVPAKSEFHGDIAAREAHAANILRREYLKHPTSLIYVIFGDLHLSDQQLPLAVKKAFKSKSFRNQNSLREVIIHLNSERIYFQLARRGLELSVDVVRLPKNRFCILTSPPWVQWQNYLLHFEQDEIANFQDEDDDDDEGIEEFDPTDHVTPLIRLMVSEMKIPEMNLEHLSVYSTEENSAWISLESGARARATSSRRVGAPRSTTVSSEGAERELARRLLANGRSFYLPRKSRGYVHPASINNAAMIAGFFLHAQLCGLKRSLWKFPQDFSALIWSEAVAYFFSKLVNHKKSAENLGDLRTQLALGSDEDGKQEAMKLALDRFMSELIWFKQGRMRKERLRPRRKASYLEASRILGGMMGERLYLAYRSRKIERKELVSLFSRDVTAKNFAKEYREILRRLGQISSENSGSRSKRDRL